jgi:hypothetical protein
MKLNYRGITINKESIPWWSYPLALPFLAVALLMVAVAMVFVMAMVGLVVVMLAAVIPLLPVLAYQEYKKSSAALKHQEK